MSDMLTERYLGFLGQSFSVPAQAMIHGLVFEAIATYVRLRGHLAYSHPVYSVSAWIGGKMYGCGVLLLQGGIKLL